MIRMAGRDVEIGNEGERAERERVKGGKGERDRKGMKRG